MGYVSLIGMYHGVKKPTLQKFVGPMLVELRQLHPAMPKMVRLPDSIDADGNTRQGRRWKRKFCVKVRAMICDAKERPWLKGKLASTVNDDFRRERPLYRRAYTLLFPPFSAQNRNRRCHLSPGMRKVPLRWGLQVWGQAFHVHQWKKETSRRVGPLHHPTWGESSEAQNSFDSIR